MVGVPAATSEDIRGIFLDHLERLRADYDKRSDDSRMAAAAADERADGWTAGLERGLSIAYGAVAADLGEAIKVERSLQVISIPGGH